MNAAGQKGTSRSTRATLLKRLKDAGDDAGWREFFEAYWGLIYRTAIRAGCSASEAEDVVQETLIKLVKAMPQFDYDRERGSFKSWLLQRVWWEIRTRARKRHRDDKVFVDCKAAVEEAASETTPDAYPTEVEAFWELEWRERLVEVAVERVKQRANPRSYQLFDLVANGGLRPKEVARRMQVPVVQVYLAKHRITRMLAAEVRQLQEGPCD